VDKFQKDLAEFFEVCKGLQERKRHDYTGDNDPLYNYHISAALMGVSTPLGMLGRLQEKVVRVGLALRGGALEVADESVKDSLRDIAILASLIAVSTKEDVDNNTSS
tara:strand:- start:1880 stop:2200 length:321 start_codon:yes stop_codon:yes gene_type:complete